MRLPKLLETLTRTPLLIMPSSGDSILTLFNQHALMSRDDFRAAREGKDYCGEAVELEQMTVEDALAMIPVKGPLGIGLDAFEKGAGATDYLDIMADIAAANENPQVENGVLVFDTPGGMFGGLPECADAIASSEKPMYAYVPPGGRVASAGMYLAAACSGRFLSPSSQAGSIGVYCAYTDLSEMAKQRGIAIKVFSSGIYKGMGVPGTSLTAEQEEYLQNEVMTLAKDFYDHIRGNLGEVPDDAMQGQMFRAAEAVALGFADEIVESLDELKAFLK
ncbi:MAG: S49 family peptidase [Bryobacteraceae bacterium]